ncbi:hypothetical protein L6164_022583 [Bauhinia variegata]|uniref:Uncharacterized protein n=1 Tax=Bauhinia variegata TaxID=167791 RepID=A0ACB9MGJ2_BAUVA|nr:hypothetical protein L6164_022583 [Bauhinia variegata]
MATRMLLRTDPKLSLKFLRNPSLAHPQFTASILQTKTVNEALQLPLNQNLQLCDFLGVSQKLVIEEASAINVRECFNGCAVSFAGRGRGTSRQRIDSEDDEEEDKFEDFDEEMEDDLDDDFEDDDEDFEDEDNDFDEDYKKFGRKKK